MNGVVRLKHIEDYCKVSYYSVVLDQDNDSLNNTVSLFEKFIHKEMANNLEKVNHILSWIETIGEKYGAQEKYFRAEQSNGEAVGLPPKQSNTPPMYLEDGEATPNNLRLYCHRLNDHVVILFCGAIKTEEKAQDCPNVKSHFKTANLLTKIIDIAIKEKEIRWNDDFDDIEFDDDLTLHHDI